MRLAAGPLASVTLLVAGCAASPPAAPARVAFGDPDDARVGDRVDLRLDLEEVRGGAARDVSVRAFAEVVRREGDLAWVRLGVRDAQGAPVDHPTVGRDLVVPFDCSPMGRGTSANGGVHHEPQVERVELASGQALECEVWTREAEDPAGGTAHDWVVHTARLPLLQDRARRTYVLYGAAGEHLRTSFEVTSLGFGPAPGDGGALPADAQVLFQPGRYEVTREGEAVVAHQLEDLHGGSYAYVAGPLTPLADGSVEVDGARYARPAPLDRGSAVDEANELARGFAASTAREFRSLFRLLENRALAAARGEPEVDPVVAWRARPVVAAGPAR